MRAKILQPTAVNIAQVVKSLAAGQVVGMPTETVYGLAADAANADAVLQVFAVKERPAFDPLIVHVSAELNELTKLAAAKLIDPAALSAPAVATISCLLQHFWPGPLTLVLPKHHEVLDLVTSGLPQVALRMPRHQVAQALLAQFGRPLAAPSANRFGRISPTTATHVLAELGEDIDLVLDGGDCEHGIESTVLSVDSNAQVTLLRPGSIALEAIEKVLEQRVARQHSVGNAAVAMASPGQLLSHYAPRKPLYILPQPLAAFSARANQAWEGLRGHFLSEQLQSAAILTMTVQPDHLYEDFAAQTQLTVKAHQSLVPPGSANSAEIAAHYLFAALRQLDQDPYTDVILVEPVLSAEGLWLAVADRLRRASRRFV